MQDLHEEEDLGRLSLHGGSCRPRGWHVTGRSWRRGGASKQAIAGRRDGTTKHRNGGEPGSEARVDVARVMFVLSASVLSCCFSR